VWLHNFTAASFISCSVTVFALDIEGIQNKVICFRFGTTCSVNVTSTCSANLYDISGRKPFQKGQFKIASGPENENSPLSKWSKL